MTPSRPTVLRLSELASRKPTRFKVEPDADARAVLAGAIGILGIERLRFAGTMTPRGKTDWALEARLAARVVQACVVTTEPVATEIDEPVERLYVADLPEIEADEVEMPEDDRLEALPASVDLAEVMAEALSLALPLYPRTPGAGFGGIAHAGLGTEALTDETAKPFAGLAAMLKKDGEPER